VLNHHLNEAPHCVMVQCLGVRFRSDSCVGDGRAVFDSVIVIAWHITSKLCHLFRHIRKEALVNKALNEMRCSQGSEQ
jgi:hypothetical protein